jgi:hypothetical protein
MAYHDDHIPPASLILGFGPMLLLLLCAVLAWLLPAPSGRWAVAGGWLFGAAILLFLAGVERGMSFHVGEGAPPRQIALMLALFALGVAALVLSPRFSFLVAATGYAIIGAADPLLARSGGAPAHFRRLRPAQMIIAVLALLLLAARVWHAV